jgi:hypothetical protein
MPKISTRPGLDSPLQAVSSDVVSHCNRKGISSQATITRALFLRGRSRTITLRGVFVNPCKLPIALHYRSSSIPVSPTEGFGHCFVNARRFRQPLHPYRLLGVLAFSSSSVSTLPPCCSHRSRASLCVSAVTGFGCDSLAKPRARSSLPSNRSTLCSPPGPPSRRPAKEAAIAVFRNLGRAE